MTKSLENKLHNYPRAYLTDTELKVLLGGSTDSYYSKVKRLLAQRKLLRIRRGLYGLPNIAGQPARLHPFELAQYIYAPSYISLESALSFHKLIPEAVYAITSASAKRSKEFSTCLGRFNYLHLPLENLYLEVELISENNHRFFMAKPWKAICDYVFCYRKNWRGIKVLSESLRINDEDLPSLQREEIELLDEYYHQRRLSRFLKSIKRDLAL